MFVRLIIVLLVVTSVALPLKAQPPVNLSGIAFILDPGHSQNENIGIYNYSEARKVLRVAFHLKEFLQTSNPDTVIMTRTDDIMSVSIAQRYNLANGFPHPNKWFQSIHSDAATMGSSTNSILILLSDNCWVSSPGKICQSRWGQTTIKVADFQSDIMARNYRIPTRGVYGDRTFGFQFGTSYGTSGVGVLRETLMPATLTEGGFHTNPRQNLLNMNNESMRSEGKAIWYAMLANYGIPRPNVRTLSGAISDIESNIPLKGAQASTSGQTYTTNTHQNTFAPYCGTDTTCSNGYYYFENLPGGTINVTFSAPGYFDSTVQVAVSDTFFTFRDIKLLSNRPPRLTSSVPAQNQIGVQVNVAPKLDFSRSLERPSSVANIRLLGPTNDTLRTAFVWSNSDRTLQLTPDSLLKNDKPYKIFIGGQVRDLFGNLFDGDGNGIGGDSLIINFRTRPIDITAPVIVKSYPGSNDTLQTPNHVISVTFDEILDTNTVTLANFVVGEIGGVSVLPRTIQHWIIGEKSGVNIYLNDPMTPGQAYRIRVNNVSDRWGNVMTSGPLWNYYVAPNTFTYTTIDDFNTTVSNWWPPTSSGSTVGVDSATFAINTTRMVPILSANTGSASLSYFWRTSVSSWLLREYLGSGTPRSVIWRKENTRLQVYLFGDGNNSQFRFAIDDSVDAFPGGNTPNHEVNSWRTIDWIGWRLVDWDLEKDSIGSWLGNGRLEGELRFDSFHLRYLPGTSSASGLVYFDQLQLAKKVVSGIVQDPSVTPERFALHQNYPNPFNPETRISYDIDEQGFVNLTVTDILGRTIRTLVSEPQTNGRYSVTWNGRDDGGNQVSSGIYLYRLQSGRNMLTGKMTLLK